MHEEEVPETPQSDESPTFDLVMSTRQKPSRWDQSSQQQPPGERRDPYAFVGTTPPKAGADEGRRRTPVSAGKPPITGYNVLARYERGDDTAAAGKGTWAFPLMPLKSEIMLPHYAAPLCCHYADYAAIMPIMPPFNCFK
jgi:hypothetical protein